MSYSFQQKSPHLYSRLNETTVRWKQDTICPVNIFSFKKYTVFEKEKYNLEVQTKNIVFRREINMDLFFKSALWLIHLHHVSISIEPAVERVERVERVSLGLG